MGSPDSPGSPLSDIDSDEFTDAHQSYHRSRDDSASQEDSPVSTPVTMPPAKRRRTTYDHATPLSSTTFPDDIVTNVPPSPGGSISSDTSGSVPTSPSFAHLGPTHPLSTAYAAAQANPDDPEMADVNNPQITRCMWTDCPQPEQGNMDNLVNHIHDVHIGLRQKKYSCEWEGCGRKGLPHASGYALRAHMRSHTKEKPFFCALPECDRSFTRSDALAKHMRTVHETEALRPSDPVPRGHSGGLSNGGPGSTLKRIKLIVNGNSSEKKLSIIGELPPLPVDSNIKTEDGESYEPIDIDDVPFELPVLEDYYPADVSADMEDYEKAMPPSQWFRVLRRHIYWAEEEAAELQRQLDAVYAAGEILDDGAAAPPAKKDSNDAETKADRFRRIGWAQTSSLIDDVLAAETRRMLDVVPQLKKALDADADADVDMDGDGDGDGNGDSNAGGDAHKRDEKGQDRDRERERERGQDREIDEMDPWERVRAMDGIVAAAQA